MIKYILLALLISPCFYVSSQSLDSLRRELRRSNPELKALLLEYEAATKIGQQQAQLPDLEIGAGLFLLPVETRTGPQQYRVGATQMLPWPGKLTAMASLADARSKPLLMKVAARQLNLLYQLERAYFQLVGLNAKRLLLADKLDYYASLEELALRRLENARGSAADVYLLQLRRQEIARSMDQLRHLAQQEMVSINALLNRYADSQLAPSDEMDGRVAETLSFAPDLANDDPDLSQHPGLQIFVLQQAASRASIDLNELERRPDFGIGLDYIAIGRRGDGMDPPGNGRDVILPRAMLRIPLSGKKFNAKRQEEELQIQALEARSESLESQFRAEIRRALNIINNEANERYFIREQTKVLDAAIAVIRSEVANDRSEFDELLRLENQLLDYQIRIIEAQTNILVQRARIDSYLITSQN